MNDLYDIAIQFMSSIGSHENTKKVLTVILILWVVVIAFFHCIKNKE